MAPQPALARQDENDDGPQLTFPAVPGSARDGAAIVRGDDAAPSEAMARRYNRGG